MSAIPFSAPFRDPSQEFDDVGPSISLGILDEAARILRIEACAESRESLDEIGIGPLGRDRERGSSSVIGSADVR